MSNYTPNLNLFKYDRSVNGEEKFSIEKALNENWDKLDAASKKNQFLSHNAQVYSEEEICIGSFFGKPLYRKTILTRLPSTVSDSPIIGQYDGTDVEKIVRVDGCVSYTVDGKPATALPIGYQVGPGHQNNISVWLDQGNIYCHTGLIVNQPLYITYYYTKISDPEGSAVINNPKKYSLEEQIVGEWYNGKPIYRISVDVPSTGTRNDESDMIISVPTLKSIDRLITLSGGLIVDGNYILHYGTMVQTTVHKTGYIVIKADSSFWENREASYTIEYTKTTDVVVES